MSTIPDDILTVAGVVIGEDRVNLTGWQRRDAIAAMTALGYSGRHIAWAMDTTRNAIYQTATEIGIQLHQRDQSLDWTAVEMVVSGAARIRLTGADRDEALRRMAPHHTGTEIAVRLRTDTTSLGRVARRLGITLTQAEQWNWYAYIRHYDRPRAVAA